MTDEYQFRNFNVTKTFIACSGLSLKHGVSHTDPSEGILKRRMLGLSENRYLVLDEAKFDAVAPLRLCSIDELSAICTNCKPSQEYTTYLKEHGIQLSFDESTPST